jgi:prevent-host-death family protein
MIRFLSATRRPPKAKQKRKPSAKTLGQRTVYNGDMAKEVIRISDAEAANDFASLLDRVSAGAEVIIERNSRPVAVVRSAEAPRGRLLSESIALAEAHVKELGFEPTMDADFAADLREIINSRKPRDPCAWD